MFILHLYSGKLCVVLLWRTVRGYLRFLIFRGSCYQRAVLLASPAEVSHGLANSDVGYKLSPILQKCLVSSFLIFTYFTAFTIQSPYLLYKKDITGDYTLNIICICMLILPS